MPCNPPPSINTVTVTAANCCGLFHVAASADDITHDAPSTLRWSLFSARKTLHSVCSSLQTFSEESLLYFRTCSTAGKQLLIHAEYIWYVSFSIVMWKLRVVAEYSQALSYYWWQSCPHCALCEHDHVDIFRIWTPPYSYYYSTNFAHKGQFTSQEEQEPVKTAVSWFLWLWSLSSLRKLNIENRTFQSLTRNMELQSCWCLPGSEKIPWETLWEL